MTIEKQLKKHFKVKTAANGLEVLAMVKDGLQVDAFVLADQLPILNGLQTSELMVKQLTGVELQTLFAKPKQDTSDEQAMPPVYIQTQAFESDFTRTILPPFCKQVSADLSKYEISEILAAAKKRKDYVKVSASVQI